ncbi:MAG TPA: VOC family protein [Candidatus Dormibacteraeota bacterium]|nr:VOC family protein [Candidatus Dormibacteraeota bacterium]
MQKIRPFLWFDGKAEEAMNFYVSIFKNSRVLGANRFELEGQEFMAFDGGPEFTFSPAISFFVDCKTQEEVDELWAKLSEGGQTLQCGWLKDKYGVSWQIVPEILGELLSDPDPVKAKRVMDAMLRMVKIEIQGLRDAYEQQ